MMSTTGRPRGDPRRSRDCRTGPPGRVFVRRHQQYQWGLALSVDVPYASGMRTLSLGCGLGALAVALAVSACGNSPVFIRTLDPNDIQESCYTSGVAGTLVADSTAGTAIVDGITGQRVIVTWPRSWTGRSAGREVEIVNRRGQTVYRTGTHVNLSGGFSYVDGSFIVCGLELIEP